MSKKKGSTKGGSGGVDLDAILDQALDEFEAVENEKKAQQLMKSGGNIDEGDHVDAIAQKSPHKIRLEQARSMEEVMKGLEDPKFGQTLHDTLKSLSTTAEGSETVNDLFHSIRTKFDSGYKPSFVPGGNDMQKGLEQSEREIVGTLSLLNQAQTGMEGFEPAKMEEVGEKMMEDMIAQFEALGDKEDYNEVIDGVMRQLLSRDLMYQPMKEICNKFPEWLALHKINLSEGEYTNYGKQYQTFQKLLAVYDTEPDNFPRLMELMFDLQSFGQPPSDIIKDLAPNLKFDENGMPIMPNMGAGMMPEGTNPTDPNAGLPDLNELASKMATGQCSIS